MSRECYAKSLGNCYGGLTREHYISEVILKKHFPGIILKGPNFPKKILPPSSFCAKILCNKHNSGLSQLDVSASFFFDYMMEIAHSNPGTFNPIAAALSEFIHLKNFQFETVQEIDGKLLERWFLKSFLGLLHAKQIKFTLDPILHDKLIQILFGLSPWPKNTGLYYLIPKKTYKTKLQKKISFQIDSNEFVIIHFCSFYFVLKFKNIDLNQFLTTYYCMHSKSVQLDFDLKYNRTKGLLLNPPAFFRQKIQYSHTDK